MSYPLPPARAALLLAVFVTAPSCAAQESGAPRPDQATAKVPETRYSAPADYRPPEAPPTTPDRHWIEANRTVSSYKPMMLTMPERPPAREPGRQHGHDEKGHH